MKHEERKIKAVELMKQLNIYLPFSIVIWHFVMTYDIKKSINGSL